MLHFAPEHCFHLAERLGERHVAADLDPGKADLQLDIRALALPDASFDAVICSHVLEHVDRDRDALAELRRIVTADGWVLLMVPQDLDRAETYEDPAVAAPAARRAAYWQDDHVRLYGRDFAARIAAAGFAVEVVSMSERLGPVAAARHGLLPVDLIHLCRRYPPWREQRTGPRPRHALAREPRRDGRHEGPRHRHGAVPQPQAELVQGAAPGQREVPRARAR